MFNLKTLQIPVTLGYFLVEYNLRQRVIRPIDNYIAEGDAGAGNQEDGYTKDQDGPVEDTVGQREETVHWRIAGRQDIQNKRGLPHNTDH